MTTEHPRAGGPARRVSTGPEALIERAAARPGPVPASLVPFVRALRPVDPRRGWLPARGPGAGPATRVSRGPRSCRPVSRRAPTAAARAGATRPGSRRVGSGICSVTTAASSSPRSPRAPAPRWPARRSRHGRRVGVAADGGRGRHPRGPWITGSLDHGSPRPRRRGAGPTSSGARRCASPQARPPTGCRGRARSPCPTHRGDHPACTDRPAARIRTVPPVRARGRVGVAVPARPPAPSRLSGQSIGRPTSSRPGPRRGGPPRPRATSTPPSRPRGCARGRGGPTGGARPRPRRRGAGRARRRATASGSGPGALDPVFPQVRPIMGGRFDEP